MAHAPNPYRGHDAAEDHAGVLSLTRLDKHKPGTQAPPRQGLVGRVRLGWRAGVWAVRHDPKEEAERLVLAAHVLAQLVQPGDQPVRVEIGGKGGAAPGLHGAPA